MIYQCFLDESKDRTARYSYVCGGFWARESTWKRFSAIWDAQRKSEGIAYFKTIEWRRLEGEFARYRLIDPKLGRIAADDVRERLLAVVSKYSGIRGVAVAIPVSVFAALKAHPSSEILNGLRIYDSAFQHVLDLVAKKITNGYVSFAHDDGSDFHRLREVYNTFCKVNDRYRAPKMGGFISLDDKLHGPLQIADMLANSVMRGHEDMITQTPRDGWFELWDDSEIRYMDEHAAFAMLAHELRRRGHDVPPDLVPYLPELLPKHQNDYPVF